MKVSELIQALEKMPQDAEIRTWDTEWGAPSKDVDRIWLEESDGEGSFVAIPFG